MAALPPAMEGDIAHVQRSRTEDAVARIDAGLQRCQRRHGLEGRAGRILAGQRLVREGVAGIGAEELPIGGAEPAVEGAGIEAGHRAHGQHVAGADVDHHRGGALLRCQALLDEFLQPDVERADQLDAGLAVAPVELADDAAERVHLDLAGAGGAAQLGVVDLFQPALADAESRELKQRIVADLVLRRRSDIAQHMGGGAAIGIGAALVDLDAGAGKVGKIDLDPGDQIPVEVGLHRDRQEGAPLRALAHQPLDLVRCQRQDAAERGQRLAHAGGLLRHDDNPIVRIVDRQRHAEAVDDLAAQRRQQMQIDPVLLRQQPEAVGLEDLQVIHPPDQSREQQRLTAGQQGHPAREGLLHLLLGLLQGAALLRPRAGKRAGPGRRDRRWRGRGRG